MQVVRATAMGMCFGVADALDATRSQKSPGDVTILGELVHNDLILEELDGRGFLRIARSSEGSLAETSTVLVTAHGISDREHAVLERSGKRVVDTTCPLVRRAHDVAKELHQEGYFVLVIGKPGHVEVEGIVGDLERFEVVASPLDARDYGESRLGVIAQTTTRPEVACAVLDRIRTSNPASEIRFVDTICQPTKDRQIAARELLEKVEAVVVVGGRGSNNTRELLETARSCGVPAFHITEARELDPSWFSGFQVVGLTAGTSTPDSIIDEVHEALSGICRRRPSDTSHTRLARVDR